MRIKSDSYDFGLVDVIVPKEPRPISEHRLLVHDAKAGVTVHSRMLSIGDHLREGDILVFNNSRVMPVSLYLPDNTFVLVIEPHLEHLKNVRVICPFKPSVGTVISFPYCDVVLTDHEPGWDVYRANIVPRDGTATMSELLDRHGQFPLPIYINRQPSIADANALQNPFAAVSGSIAPPVAATHFDEALLKSLQARGVGVVFVTLHVGYGTFRSFKTEYVDEHVMDAESFNVSRDAIFKIESGIQNGNRIIAVGTTSARVLETLGRDWVSHIQSEADVSGETTIFISPPYTPTIVGGLITNFQYPRLPVIAMAATFVGLENLRDVYVEAHALKYNFFSFGDAMLLTF